MYLLFTHFGWSDHQGTPQNVTDRLYFTQTLTVSILGYFVYGTFGGFGSWGAKMFIWD